MVYIIIFVVCFLASVIGSICGIGGGVIIKPVLDATGIMNVATISFLSGCTVLSMSVVSLYKNMKRGNNYEFQKKTATILAMGAVVGGILGKTWYQNLLASLSHKEKAGAVQAFVLMLVTLAALIYTINKEKIKTKTIKNKIVVCVIGMVLGIMSSFLGIGGGPINLIVLFYFFSMATKEAAVYSIYIIMFSQIASLVSSLLSRNIPVFGSQVLLLMILGGITGGVVGSKINVKIDSRTVDKLFNGLMMVIVCICIYNMYIYF